jgi:expansin (peptidoglycan-binding protein)
MDTVAPNDERDSSLKTTSLNFVVEACPQGPQGLINDHIHIVQKKGSSSAHLVFMVRDALFPVTAVKLKNDGEWTAMEFRADNTWVLDGAKEGYNYDLQLSDGIETLDVNVTLPPTAEEDGKPVDTKQQFKAICSP